MDKHSKQCVFILVLVILFLTVPYLVYTYAQDDSNSATGCFILNQQNLPSGSPLPDGCGDGSNSTVVQSVITLAQAHLKTGTYVWGSPDRNWADDKSTGPNNPPHFDCSGFVGWAWYWGSDGKIVMAGQTNDDWDNETNNPHYEKIITHDESQMQPGDLIYFNFGSDDPPEHVGMYVGNDTSKYSCGKDDCFIQYYESGLPGDEESLKPMLSNVMGVIRMRNI